MSEPDRHHATEAEAREVVEAARQKEWTSSSFMRELFLGNLRLEVIDPFPAGSLERPEFVELYEKVEAFLREQVDPVAIDESGEYPEHVIEGLRRLGLFGMKIPKEYGGLGLRQFEYDRLMQLISGHDPNVGALLSAHQSIGVPQPLKLFGSERLKEKYLPRCARGAISAFALTEPDVGSDPARLATTVELAPDGEGWILNGEKLWCTNGTFAELLVVMARHKETGKISAFVVESDWPGVEVVHRCRFMGLRAIGNAVLRFRDVRVPKENLIGEEGRGLKIALVTLNTGRLALPAGACGTVKQALAAVRRWAGERVQWGVPIGKHEAIAHMLADMAASSYAMDAVSECASGLADRPGYDIRLEAAAAKEFNTVTQWKLIDTAMQIRGGRGYETERSLAARGEEPIGIERQMRDARINRIFEGSSEIMHLFMAREAVDKHLEVAGALIDPRASVWSRLAALPRIVAFYAWWYPSRWLGWGWWPRFGRYGRLARWIRFVERNCRKLARSIFHGMLVHRAKLERKQAFLFRLVDVGMELFAMAASVSRARAMRQAGHPAAAQAEALADVFCRQARRRVQASFRALWRNDDAHLSALARQVLAGEHAWLEEVLYRPERRTAPEAQLAHGQPQPPPALSARAAEPEPLRAAPAGS
ncbi:MAG: putative acyl-CoA dehydrogenase FadE10 [Planctomycetota bacterium]|nr:MAG: putative acyl-CoA dehydrogenase FadE10 [Planctomycetota bacterium]